MGGPNEQGGAGVGLHNGRSAVGGPDGKSRRSYTYAKDKTTRAIKKQKKKKGKRETDESGVRPKSNRDCQQVKERDVPDPCLPLKKRDKGGRSRLRSKIEKGEKFIDGAGEKEGARGCRLGLKGIKKKSKRTTEGSCWFTLYLRRGELEKRRGARGRKIPEKPENIQTTWGGGR